MLGQTHPNNSWWMLINKSVKLVKHTQTIRRLVKLVYFLPKDKSEKKKNVSHNETDITNNQNKHHKQPKQILQTTKSFDKQNRKQ